MRGIFLPVCASISCCVFLCACEATTFGISDGESLISGSTNSGLDTDPTDATPTTSPTDSDSGGGLPISCSDPGAVISDEFLDTALRCAVDKAIDPNSADCVFICEQALALTSLSADYTGGAKIMDLTGLEHLPNLTYLSLSSHYISSTAQLPALPALTNLSLVLNPISSLADFPKLPQISDLNLIGTSITSLDGLPSSKSLTRLSLASTAIDLATLQNLNESFPALSYLDLSSNGITSDKLLSLPALEISSFNLAFNQIVTVGGLQDFIQLENLYLANCQLTAQSFKALSLQIWVDSAISVDVSGNPINCGDPDAMAAISNFENAGVMLTSPCT